MAQKETKAEQAKAKLQQEIASWTNEHKLAVVDNTNKFAGASGDNFLSSERPAAAFNELKMRISLVGAINIEI